MRAILSACALVSLAGCSAASGAEVDPKNDVHCSALATAFRIAADLHKVPQYQKTAFALVDDWYARKLVEASRTQGRDSVMTQAAVVAKAVDEDMLSLGDEATACAERAVKEGLKQRN